MEAAKSNQETPDVPKASAAPAVRLDDPRPSKTAPTAGKAAPGSDKQPPNPAASKPAGAAPRPAPGLLPRIAGAGERYGYQAAGALVVLGIGWIVGANSFDNHASEKRVAEALVALDDKIDLVSRKVVSTGEVAALKRNLDEMKRALDGSRRTTAAVADLRSRFEASERARAAAADALVDKVAERLSKDQGDRLDKLAERLDKIEHQLASQIPTASIPAPQARGADPVQVPGVTMPMAGPTTPATPAASTSPKDRDARAAARLQVPERGYVLRDVQRGVALVEGRRGLVEVAPGDTLPGAGRVRAIERRNRQWVVVTSNGVIDGSGY